MDVKNLETASDYINNLLLSRGLLRNGEPISFAHPSQGEGGKQATIAKVINLVHDLILRRDRESDTLTKLSQDAAVLRSASIQQSQTIHKLESRTAELERQLALKSESEKTVSTSLRTAEVRNKALKEDMTRLKATVGQIKAQCANDVRKKETELKRLQKYLEAKRGREGSIQVGVTVVTPGVSPHGSVNSQGSRQSRQTSLLEDTTEYLTQLGRELSTENEALRSLAQSTTSTLRELQGIPEPITADESSYDGSVSFSKTIQHEALEADLTELLNHLRSLLTNPSFVPLEEVEIREEEIVRLREGWEKMETRWREALSLMNSWRKRMMETGDAINLDDLRKGLILGSTPITMPPPTSVRKGRLSAGHLPSPDDSLMENENNSLSLEQRETSIRNELNKNARPVSPVSRLEDKLGMGLFPAPNVLYPTTGNSQRIPKPRRRSIEVVDEMHEGPLKRRRISQETPGPDMDIFLNRDAIDQQDMVDGIESEDEMEMPLTIEEKLSRARREAEEAAAALRKAVLAPVRESSPQRNLQGQSTHQTCGVSHDTVNKKKEDILQANSTQNIQAKPVKRTRMPIKVGPDGTKRSKRRSTLSPQELEGLIGV